MSSPPELVSDRDVSPQSRLGRLSSAMARETFVRYRTLCLLAVLAVLSCVCVGLLVALLSPGSSQQTAPAPAPAPAAAGGAATEEGGGGQVEPEDGGTAGKTEMKQLTEPWEKEYRIPASTYALHYDLYLHPNMETGLFSGTVDILIRWEDRARGHDCTGGALISMAYSHYRLG